jgi:photosynthetic reaction center cytochrome c subunit
MKPSYHGVYLTLAAMFLFGGSILVSQSQQRPPSPKPAEQVFKNIQILKDVPSDQVIPSMQFISASLGVECEFCHVSGAFDKDDKEPKSTARKMMQMMSAINKQNFDGKREVTCYSCHRGSTHPTGVPVIPTAEELVSAGPKQLEKPAIPQNPAAEKAQIDVILEKYLAASGGTAALQRVTSRIETGSADLAGKKFPIEIYALAPNLRLSVMHLTNGDSATGFDGANGWMSAPGRPAQWMSEGEAKAAGLDADLRLPIRIRELFTTFKLLPKEKIAGLDTTVLEGVREGSPPVAFYFDDSGLLVRTVRYNDTALGLNPMRIDYSDYRNSEGVKIPYSWTIARPSGQFTIQLEKVQQNVPVAPEQFAMPQKPSP